MSADITVTVKHDGEVKVSKLTVSAEFIDAQEDSKSENSDPLKAEDT